MSGKKLAAARAQVDREKLYQPIDAVRLLKSLDTAKFDETVEVHFRLGINVRHAEEQLRGTIMLPHGTGSNMRVAVFAQGDKVAEAEAAGADIVWVGHAEPWKKLPGFDALRALPQVTLVPLDVTDGRSVVELAGEIGGKVDIVVNNAEVHRAHGIGARRGTDAARAEMDVNYFGLLRLAQEFGPALKGRSSDGATHATAWVNLLSIYALANFPPHGTFSASKAAAHSLAQCLRAEMRPAGIRVVNVFPGPVDDEWNQNLPPPKLAPETLARAVVQALKDGVEDVYPGDVAQEWLERWREDPRVLERELAAGG